MSEEECTINVSGDEFNLYNTPCVYAWKRGDEWLYVGTSNRGICRLYSHTTIGKIEPVQTNDTIVLWFYKNPVQAMMNEAELIIVHQPKYNKIKDTNILLSTVITRTSNINKPKKMKRFPRSVFKKRTNVNK